MTTIVIDRQTALAMEQFTELWFVPLPENHERIKIEVGQKIVNFLVQRTLITQECAFYSEKTGGNLIGKAEIINSNVGLPAHVKKDDRIIYEFDWSNF